MNSIIFLFVVVCAISFVASFMSLRIRRQHLNYLHQNKENGLLEYDARRAIFNESVRIALLSYLLFFGTIYFIVYYSQTVVFIDNPPFLNQLATFFVAAPFLIAAPSFHTLLGKKTRAIMAKKLIDFDRLELERQMDFLIEQNEKLRGELSVSEEYTEEVFDNRFELERQLDFLIEQNERLRGELSVSEEHTEKVFDFFLILNGASRMIEARGPKGIHVAPVPLQLPDEDQLDEILETIRSGQAPLRSDIEYLGGVLFEALFPAKILRAFERARSVLPHDARLRVNLAIRTPQLSDLPWELLYDYDGKRFWGLRITCPFVRFIESGIPLAKRTSTLPSHPLRLLYVQANPLDTEPLDLEASEKAIEQALKGQAEIQSIRDVTPRKLRDVLRDASEFHILHYDGHAVFDQDLDSGSIFLHDTGGHSYPLDGERLATYLDGTKIQLVVLAACETGVDSSQKRFMGVAHQLMHSSELPAVVAMQFAIPDDSAIAFNEGFYEALADGYPIDMAIIEGRKAILEHLGGTREALASSDWAAPVLWMRSKLDKTDNFVEWSRNGYDEENKQSSISKTGRRNSLGLSILPHVLRGVALARSSLHRMVSPTEKESTT